MMLEPLGTGAEPLGNRYSEGTASTGSQDCAGVTFAGTERMQAP